MKPIPARPIWKPRPIWPLFACWPRSTPWRSGSNATPTRPRPTPPRETTLTVGVIHGGTAGNILARECEFLFDLRYAPGVDARAVLADFFAEAAAMDAELKARFPEAGVVVAPRFLNASACRHRSTIPPRCWPVAWRATMAPRARCPTPPRPASSSRPAIPSSSAAPASSTRPTEPDEFVDIAQMQRGAAFMARAWRRRWGSGREAPRTVHRHDSFTQFHQLRSRPHAAWSQAAIAKKVCECAQVWPRSSAF